MGLTIRIKNAPTAVPIKAPKMGISAVKPTRTEIIAAYGIRKISIPAKHKIPMMIASVNWPVIKLLKILLESPPISSA